MNKKEETNARLRYIRALERFSKTVVSYLSKAQEITKEGYDKKIANALKLLERTQKMPLYKSELQELEQLRAKMRSKIFSAEKIEEIKKDILYSANQLEKSRNFKRYKKPKHSKSTLDEWEN